VVKEPKPTYDTLTHVPWLRCLGRCFTMHRSNWNQEVVFINRLVKELKAFICIREGEISLHKFKILWVALYQFSTFP
jgi:hypothetical protein